MIQQNEVAGMKRLLLIIILFAVTACTGWGIGNNLENGYQRGDVSEGVKEDVAWYCGPGLMGIRAATRFGLKLLGVPVPDTCRLLDVVTDN